MRHTRRLWILFALALAAVAGACWQPARGAAEGPRRWALVVGIDKYDNAGIAPLRYAGADARLVARTLIETAGFSPGSVVLMTSGENPNEHPSSTNILRWLYGFRNAVKPQDTFLFYFSGHGIMINDQSRLVTAETSLDNEQTVVKTSLGVDEVKEAVKGIHAGRLVEIVDACRSDPRHGSGSLSDEQAHQYEVHGNDVWSDQMDLIATLFATSPGHRSYEGKDGHGYFTYYLVRGLRGEAAQSDGSVTLRSLLDYLRKAVPEAVSANEPGHTQVPYGDLHGRGVDSWVIDKVAAGSAELATNTPSDTAEPVVNLSMAPVSSTNERMILLQGNVLYGRSKVSNVSVAVNGQPVRVVRSDTNGSSVGESLRVAVDLEPGDNAITVTALSSDGTPVQKTVTVKCTATDGRITAANPDVKIFAANGLQRGSKPIDQYLNKWSKNAARWTIPDR